MALQYDYMVPGIISINTDVCGPTSVQDSRSVDIRVLSLGTTGVLTLQGSEDGTTWNTINVVAPSGSVVSTMTVIGMYRAPVYYAQVRVRLTTATTAGRTVVSTRLSANPFQYPVPIPATQPVSGTVAVSGNVNAVQVLSGTIATGTVLANSRLVSAGASTNAMLVKASAGRVAGIHAYNATAVVKYLKLYNKATAPVPGTDTPLYTFALEPGATSMEMGTLGLPFSTGIGFGITGLVADADVTALVAGDVTALNVVYI